MIFAECWLKAKVVVEETKGIPSFIATAFPHTAMDGDIAQVLPAYANKTIDDVKAANGEGSVAASSKDGKLYAFPMGGGIYRF